MPSMITDLWYGNLAPFDKCGAHDAQALQLAALMEHNRETLFHTCTDQQKEVFQKYTETKNLP